MKKALQIAILTISALLLIVVAFDFMGFSLYEKDTWEKISDEPVLGKYYYDFTEVVYYKTTKGFDDLIAIDDKKVMTLKDSVTFQIMTGFEEVVPYDVEATYLDSIGFEKKIIPVSRYAALYEIFRVKIRKHSEAAACMPIYRDIYVFKKQGKVIGIAKLCYSCGQSQFIGTSAETSGFGMDGEFEKLKELVK
jgi:hypothetical protein